MGLTSSAWRAVGWSSQPGHWRYAPGCAHDELWDGVMRGTLRMAQRRVPHGWELMARLVVKGMG